MSHPIDPSAAPPVPAFTPLRLADLAGADCGPDDWLWQGYLAPGSLTLLTSQWKLGKTTLVAVLLAKMKAGGELAGLPVRPGRAAVVSEEGPRHWQHRGDKLAFGDNVCWFCRPFRGRPRPNEWLALIDCLAELRRTEGLDLVVIDPLASFLPSRDENSSDGVLGAVQPLQRLTAAGVAVLVLHHPSKKARPDGRAARGSGALTAWADVVLEMDWYGSPDGDDRRRRLRAWSRHEATPRRRVIELTADGTDYVSRGDFDEEAYGGGWLLLRRVLEGAEGKLTRREALSAWPIGEPAPDEALLWRWLTRAVDEGRVCRDRTGHRNDPFRYWLPGMEEKWKDDPYFFDPLTDLDHLPTLDELYAPPQRRKRGKSKAKGEETTAAGS